jgi:hypothetical protein
MDISDYPYVWAGISAWVNEPIIYIMLSKRSAALYAATLLVG